MKTHTLTLADPAAAAAFGARLAGLLQRGDAILLSGDLGAGKTTLARGVIAAAAGVEDAPSPTYTLVQSYEGADGFLLLHADLYRLEDAGELEELGIGEALDHGAVLIEWPGRLAGQTFPDRLEIALAETQDGARQALLTAHGSWEGRLDQLV